MKLNIKLNKHIALSGMFVAALGGGLVASLVACNSTPPPQQETPPTQPSSATA